MHGIHHSIVQRENQFELRERSFCWWDKFHRTLRRDISQDEITIGVAAYRDEKELTVGNLLRLPFRETTTVAITKWRVTGSANSTRRSARQGLRIIKRIDSRSRNAANPQPFQGETFATFLIRMGRT